MEGNWFAVAALFSWPLVVFGLVRKVELSQALLWTILGGQLLLPAGSALKIAMIPALDKASIPNLAILLACILSGQFRPAKIRKSGWINLLLLVFIFSPLVTAQLNGDVIPLPNGVLPSVGLYDGVSSVISQCVILIPFILGRNILTTERSTEQIFRSLAIAGLFYSLPMLFEIRMSPQLQAWIYGFMPGEFYQQAREGSFRPTVFMGHGLIAAFFLVTCAIASSTLWRLKADISGVKAGTLTAYLSSVLFLTKSFGAVLYALAFVPVARLSSIKVQFRVATILAVIVVTYPATRALDFFPAQTIDDTIRSIDSDRADSLKTRFDNERLLVDRAMERPLFGWGRYGRGRVHSQASGHDESITDGRWIITVGQYGIIGFLAEFGLLAISVYWAVSAARFTASQQDATLLAGLSLIVAINLVELIPNSTLMPWTWLLAGSLIGRTEALYASARQGRRTANVAKHRSATKSITAPVKSGS